MRVGCSGAIGPSQGLSMVNGSAVHPSKSTVDPHVPTDYMGLRVLPQTPRSYVVGVKFGQSGLGVDFP